MKYIEKIFVLLSVIGIKTTFEKNDKQSENYFWGVFREKWIVDVFLKSNIAIMSGTRRNLCIQNLRIFVHQINEKTDF